ncbi:hypothetical protein Acr_00g0038310 [Actinidia rufa]|uniref:SWIM-type domain-containing protein n=1 Tax=Actinidia rufa TaxID=165716 RepID=A0A7J0DH42_9ERIC|nr:hypothetical protein Acr_00g0038310 [Actinidia rufa]
MFALGQSSRSTLAEEAPGQRMCSLFSQGECIEAGGGSVSVDPVERLVALGQTGTQDNEDADVFQSDNSDEDIDVLLTNEANDDFDDDGHEDPNIGEPLHDNPHIPFFTNLVGADDVIGDRDLYNGCPTWSNVTPEFAKGMVFKDKDAVIRACNCFTVSYKKAWLGRTKAIAMVFGDWDSSYEKLPRFMRNVGVEKPWDSCDFRNIRLGHLIVPGMEGVTLISDRHAAIISAVKHEWETARLGQPIGIHRYCLRHFRSNYQKNFGNVKVKDLIWKAGTAHQVRKFDEAMDEIKKLGTNSESAARAYRALCNEDPMKWTLAYDGGYRWGVTTTNDSECYNNVLRGARDLPITLCVEFLMSDTNTILLSSNFRASGSAEVVTSAAGITGNHKHAVYLNPPSCDCGKWMIYHYPCSHMLAVCAKSGRQPWHLIDPKYRMDVYAHVYDTHRSNRWCMSIIGLHMMVLRSFSHPSRRRDPTSGRPTKRIHNEMDVSRKRQHNHCGICKEQGHDRRLMDTVGSPGPIDDTVLTLQSHHRSTWIWEHGGTDALACRRCGTGLYDRELDPRVLQYVLRAGFYGVHRLGPIRLDHALITAFVERWRPETHTFHLPIGEASITLQDVAILLGLPIDGAPITHPQTFVTVRECQDICMHAFGVIPPAEDIDRGRLRMSWLRRTFDVLPEHADDVSVQRHARAYILRLIGGILFTDYSQTLVRVAYLPFLLDLDAAGACSWGSAVLAMLYRSMCRATKIGQRQIVGALLLLQIWAYERFPRICPYRVDDHTTGQQPLLIGGLQFPGGPWGARWRSRFRTTTTSTHVVRVYRDQLDRLRPDEFTWRSYDDIMHELPDYCRVASDIWVSRSPLVCFEVVEWHLPDRVCRQFGLRQIIPVAANTSPELHGIDMRGRARTDWTQLHGEYIDHWHHRREYLVVGVIDAAAMRYDDPYMVWYRRITRTLVGNPAHRPTSGYVEIGSTIEIAFNLFCRLATSRAIHDRIDRAIYAYDRPESLQDMSPRTSPTIPPVVPAASPAMPPAFPVHPPPSMSSSQQFTQYVGATQTYASYVTPTMPSYTYHISAHDVPSSSRPSSSGIRPRRTTHRHITSPVTYDRCSSFSPVGDDDEFDVYVDPLLASRGQMEIPVSVEGVSQITQVEPSRDRRPPRCGTGGHV